MEEKMSSNRKQRIGRVMIAKRVWTYWNSRPLPAEVEESIASWRKTLPEYDITVLDDRSVEGVAPSTYAQLVPAVKSDVVRCHALATHGGVWLDATLTLRDNLEWVFSAGQSPAIHAFKFAREPYIENWFLAVRGNEGRRFMETWKRAFYRVLESWPHVRGFYGAPCTTKPTYYIMYEAYCFLMRTDADFARTRVHTMDARWYMHPPKGWAMPVLGSRLIKYCTAGRTFRRRSHAVVPIVVVAFIALLISRMAKEYCAR
tara:strand:- start:1861 stop:2637 length:777 start_codon:yes stop_codon:yes gene_type:complete